MKTLINKANPQIRITAPEIKVNIDTQTFYIGDEMFDMEDWTLVVEEPEKIREIRACIAYALAGVPAEKIKAFGVSLKDCLDYVIPIK